MKNTYSGITDPEAIRVTGAIVNALAKDPSIFDKLMSLMPKFDLLRDVHEGFQAKFYAAQGGGIEEVMACEAQRELLNKVFGTFAGIVRATSDDDPSVAKLLGLHQPPPIKRSSSAQPLTSPTNPKLWHGDEHGIIFAKVTPSKGSRIIEIYICEGDPSVEENWKYYTGSARASRMEIRGLVPGTLYWFRFRSIGSAGHSPWSNYVSLMAI